jgi:chemotaxis protein methyltransferase CheR
MNEPTFSLWTGDDLSDAQFTALLDLLRTLCQFDLEQYKDRCIRRRIAKRLRVCEEPDFASYLKRLKTDRDELETLLATISIHVSQFFRDPSTFRRLEQNILPDLCRRARAAGKNQLFFWSAGCATGEEPYSLAMLVDDMSTPDLDIRIMATDVSNPVLETARAGIFNSARLKEVPPEVKEKYFRTVDGRYHLIEGIREKVEFLRHNIITASNYPAADLILCRNVLIYFTRAEQDRILSRFAEILPEHGVLILGRSESITVNSRGYFHAEFPLERIYRRTATQLSAPSFKETDSIALRSH